MLKRSFILVLIIVASFFVNRTNAQDSSVITWKTDVKKTGEGKYELLFTGDIRKGWHVYPQEYALQELEGIVLSDEDSTTTYSNREFLSKSNPIKDAIFDNKEIMTTTGQVIFKQRLTITGAPPARVRIKIGYNVADNSNFIPAEDFVYISLNETKELSANRILISTIDLDNPSTDCGASSSSASGDTKSKGLLNLFLLGFLGGLVALLTPCVFPMIPLTVSFFTKKAQSKKAGIFNAFLYGFFIFLIYVLLSLPFHFLDKLNPEILNNISTNVFLNVFFFVIFIVFALSFFGLYEITLPSSMSNNTDSKAGAGNVIGIFFMALTLALVSFSCTGPILGSLLAGSLTADGGAMQLTSGMAGFGLALALPFALFALFPNLLNSLPKSGGWLTTVKVVLGFIELALAFKFLSNADLVEHWGLLKREIFIGIWVVIGLCLSLYLFGLIKFKHDSPIKKLPTLRVVLAFITLAFTIYLVPGLTNTKYANLKLISGFPPPLYYSIYKSGHDCILDLNCTRDYEEGLKMSKEQHKPMLLDFTGYACVNCRRMEENVWSQPAVYKVMKENFIIVSLYVDDKKKLSATDQFTYTAKDGSTKEIVTVGDKWATFETENFKNNAQPLYAILNSGERLLTHPVGYVPSANEYKEWLQCGLAAFHKK